MDERVYPAGCHVAIGRSSQKTTGRRVLAGQTSAPMRALERAGAGLLALARRLPRGLLGTLALVIGVEWAVAPAARTIQSGQLLPSSWHAARRAALGPESRAAIVCFGDSRAKLGILPRVLEERLGCSAYNLAVLGGQPPTSDLLLRQLLGQGNRPQALVVSFSPLLLSMVPWDHAEWWLTIAGRLDCLEVAWRARSPVLAASMIVQELVPSSSFRETIRTAICLDRLGLEASSAKPDDLRAFERNWWLNQGAQVAPRQFVTVKGDRPRSAEEAAGKWRPHPAHVFYLERFLSDAQAFRIPVYWVLTPEVSDPSDRVECAKSTPAYQVFVQAYLARFPGLTVLDAEGLTWEKSAFRDATHLNRDGALRLSLAVAAAIQRLDAGTTRTLRWIELERIEGQPERRFQKLVEDLDQSRMAIRQAGTGENPMEASRW
jgi:hypothetical protein